MYLERMNEYYPQVIRSIKEFKAIINAEYPELESLEECNERVLSDAYLLTMTEDRIKEWETVLNIQPIDGSSLEDRRETIIARIRSQGKLNTEMINTIVSTFTGGVANSWIHDGCLYVEITPPANNKSYIFENVERELRKKVPAHLNFSVSRNYYTWGEINKNHSSWENVNKKFTDWENVLLFIPFDTVKFEIVSHPQDCTGKINDVVEFKVVANGEGLEYKWQYQRPNATTWLDTTMEGYTTDTLSVPIISTRNGYKYRCVITDIHGDTLISNDATLTVSS